MTTGIFIQNQPDILEVISNLSNDEVFTPPRIANAVLDLLPADVWTNPDLRWLDPGCKTGIFPREITKRLMVGLVEAFLDEELRLEHILKNMVFAVAITELTSLMARRTVYCSKDASSEHSSVRMPSSEGNIWMKHVSHTYEKDTCTQCGGAKKNLEREGRENYAYGFIHSAGREAIKKEIGMKFDVIVGNPPYQMDSDGNTRTMPLYNLFVQQAKSLNPKYIAMIIPSRWMASGLGLNDFRAEMLADTRIRTLVDFPNASEVFPGVEIKGGVSYFLWDRDNSGTCKMTLVRGADKYGPIDRNLGEFDVLVRDSRALEILHKIQKREETSITKILAVDKEFGMTSNFTGYEMTRTAETIAIYANRQGKRIKGWIKRYNLDKSIHLIDKWKVLIPQAGSDGGQKIPDVVLGTPLVVGPPSVCTQTYLFLHLDSESEAMSAESYIKTKFVRFLISLRKISQHATRSTYTWVPIQSWDKQWTDGDLFEKYDITKDEQAYISEMIKAMA
jgi:site-specific DNA-methyltransferase (adenine-specific)